MKMQLRMSDLRLPRFSGAAVIAFATLLMTPPGAFAGPVGVSPGAVEELVGSPTACPPFSWTLLSDAREYELVVVELGEATPLRSLQTPSVAGEEGEDRVVLRHRLPGGASHWLPSAEQCLSSGHRYAWSVRARRDGGWTEWSEPLLFATPGPIVSAPQAPAPAATTLEDPIFQAQEATSGPGISSDGVIESTSGGFKFPDGSVQTQAFRMSVYHAAVSHDGTTRHGNVAATSKINTGTYQVDIGRNGVLCSATATLGPYNLAGGFVLIPAGYAVIYVEPTSPIVSVYTFDFEDKPADSTFMIQVLCSPIVISF